MQVHFATSSQVFFVDVATLSNDASEGVAILSCRIGRTSRLTPILHSVDRKSSVHVDLVLGPSLLRLSLLLFTSGLLIVVPGRCWEYALEEIIKWFISILMFMVIVYYPCYNCIKWKHNTCVEYKHQESLVSLYRTSSLIKR